MKYDIYSQVRNQSFIIAYYMLKNLDDAEDIAQIVSLKYLFREKSVEKPLPWCSKVTKNEVYSFCKKRGMSELNMKEDDIDRMALKSIKRVGESIKFHEIPPEKIQEFLTSDDVDIFNEYLASNCKTRLYVKKSGLSYFGATSKIYQMKRNLKAAYLMSQGYRVSREIITYRMNKNIVYLIHKFVEKMKENNLKSLRKYLEDFDINSIQKLDIIKVLDYEIKMLESNKYECLIPYFNSQNKVKFFIFRFYLDEKNYLKIYHFIGTPKEVIEIEHAPKEEVLKKLPPEKKGVIPLKFSEIKETLIKKRELRK